MTLSFGDIDDCKCILMVDNDRWMIKINYFDVREWLINDWLREIEKTRVSLIVVVVLYLFYFYDLNEKLT